MGKNSNVSWTDDSWGPWRGCRKVSPGCDNCYAERDMKRYGKDHGSVVRAADATFYAPLRWEREQVKLGVEATRIVFTMPWSDFFIKEADPWRDEAWGVIRQCPHLLVAIVTKRVENIPFSLPGDWGCCGYPNVMLIATCEDQQRADERIPLLLSIPAAMRGVSIEPMLGAVDIEEYLSPLGAETCNYGEAHRQRKCDCRFDYLDWVICGGESGLKARPMNPDWPRSLRDQCVAAGVPFYFKQWGEWAPTTCHTIARKEHAGQMVPYTTVSSTDRKSVGKTRWYCIPADASNDCRELEVMERDGTKRAGNLLDGQVWEQRPELTR
jgi:protein gp37